MLEQTSLPSLPALDPHLHGLEQFSLDKWDHLHIPPLPRGFGRISVGWFLQAFDLFYSLDSCGEGGGGTQSPRLLSEGLGLLLLSGGNAEHVSSRGQTAHSVETSTFLERLCFRVWHFIYQIRRQPHFLNRLLRSVFLKELTKIIQQNTWVPTAYGRHSRQ